MTSPSTVVLAACGLMLVASSSAAQDLGRYREFTLGSTLAAVAKASGTTADDVKAIHEHPAVIQELRWRPARYTGTAQADPVREVVFTFYNDELYLIVVDYDRQRTEGLTNSDLIDSMAASYGVPVLTSTNPQPTAPLAEPDGDVVIARWADTRSSFTLLRGTYPTSLRLVGTLKSVEALARTAVADSLRKDLQDAPQREADRQKKAVEDRRLAGERARMANRLVFKP